ncbi:MAG: class 1 isoprenoid biosynthesis enzyme [Roseiflexaceae bacterium]|nr:class 1 isoprenoid biosynthesis enzyme [Roseiflexaceae bacterium]
MRDHVRTRIDQLPILPELRALLLHMVQHDDMLQADHIGPVITTVQMLLGADDDVTPFIVAWRLMYAAISRLDELQDNDPISDGAVAGLEPGLRYNLVLTYYALAASMLDDLDPQRIPYQRIHRLRRVWSDSMLRMAGGQQRDLLGAIHADTTPLVAYQELAQAKTGATFALAFGGLAILCADDTDLIQRITRVGEIYGTLLQYSDDLLDQHAPNQTLTLPHALVQTYGAAVQQPHTYQAIVSLITRAYLDRVRELIQPLPAQLTSGLLDLVTTVFAPQTESRLR